MNQNPPKSPALILFAKILLPIVFIACGYAAYAYLQNTGPKIERKPHKRQLPVVEVIKAVEGDAQTVVTAMGTVLPARQITLKSRVSGEVQMISPEFTPGAYIKKGDIILKLDASDYQIKVQTAKSALEKVQADLEIEKGSQAVARAELRLLKETSPGAFESTDLALRKPQLQKAEAAVKSAEAELKIAQLDLDRTEIRAPFNALVLQRNVNMGSHVNTQDALATLVGIDEYWVEAVVPMDRLAVLDFDPKKGCPATIRSQTGHAKWEGSALRATGELNSQSLMATVIISVKDPLGLTSKNPGSQLMLNDYVAVEMLGRTMNSVISVPRNAFRDGDNVWILNSDELDIRPVKPVWKDGTSIYIRDGLDPGENIIISELTTPVQGMKLEAVDITNDSEKREIQTQ